MGRRRFRLVLGKAFSWRVTMQDLDGTPMILKTFIFSGWLGALRPCRSFYSLLTGEMMHT